MDAARLLQDELIGRTLKQSFVITELLGEGSMGTIYRGRVRTSGQEVAIKVMHPHLGADPAMRARFEREAAAAMQIQHPNAVKVLSQGFEDGLGFLVMELLKGRDLFTELAAVGRFPEERAVRIVAEVARGLGAAHALGIVHRDLKPENIMLLDGPSGVEWVKILDFGIAKRIIGGEEGESGQLTVTGALIGTPAYMAPEQCRGASVDARTDVYACGVLLFQLVTGKLPFSDDNPAVIWMQHLHEPPPLPRSLLPTIHPALEALILKALSKRPGARFQSACELVSALMALLPQLSKAADPEPVGPVRPVLSSPKPCELDGTGPDSSATTLIRRIVPAVVSTAPRAFTPIPDTLPARQSPLPTEAVALPKRAPKIQYEIPSPLAPQRPALNLVPQATYPSAHPSTHRKEAACPVCLEVGCSLCASTPSVPLAESGIVLREGAPPLRAEAKRPALAGAYHLLGGGGIPRHELGFTLLCATLGVVGGAGLYLLSLWLSS